MGAKGSKSGGDGGGEEDAAAPDVTAPPPPPPEFAYPPERLVEPSVHGPHAGLLNVGGAPLLGIGSSASNALKSMKASGSRVNFNASSASLHSLARSDPSSSSGMAHSSSRLTLNEAKASLRGVQSREDLLQEFHTRELAAAAFKCEAAEDWLPEYRPISIVPPSNAPLAHLERVTRVSPACILTVRGRWRGWGPESEGQGAPGGREGARGRACKHVAPPLWCVAFGRILAHLWHGCPSLRLKATARSTPPRPNPPPGSRSGRPHGPQDQGGVHSWPCVLERGGHGQAH